VKFTLGKWCRSGGRLTRQAVPLHPLASVRAHGRTGLGDDRSAGGDCYPAGWGRRNPPGALPGTRPPLAVERPSLSDLLDSLRRQLELRSSQLVTPAQLPQAEPTVPAVADQTALLADHQRRSVAQPWSQKRWTYKENVSGSSWLAPSLARAGPRCPSRRRVFWLSSSALGSLSNPQQLGCRPTSGCPSRPWSPGDAIDLVVDLSASALSGLVVRPRVVSWSGG
jgi:hypothetical protein